MTLADNARGPIGWRAASCFRYRATATFPVPWAHCGSVTVGPYHVSDTALRSYFRYQTVDHVFDPMP
jgi:hypothetical protein